MITDTDIIKLKGIFATKDDLKTMEDSIRHDMATKEDLNRFATKEDLKRFATKEDLNRFATKDDLKRFATKEDLKAFATKEDLKDFPTRADLKHEINQAIKTYNEGLMEGIKTIIDMIGKSHELPEKNAQEIAQHRKILNEHAQRIQALE